MEFRTMGFLPGYTKQYGQLEPISGDTFVVSGCGEGGGRLGEGGLCEWRGGPEEYSCVAAG